MVAIAAPSIPSGLFIPKILGKGMKRIFKMILIKQANVMSIKTNLDFPPIDSKLFEIIPKEETKAPNINILRAFSATRY